MQTHPESWRLSEVEWSAFGTLTFLNASGEMFVPQRWFSAGFRRSRFTALMRNHLRWSDAALRLERLPWVLRTEDGEKTGRLHLHFLVAGFAPESVVPSFCFRLARQWERMGGGFGSVRPFNRRSDSAVEYLSKCRAFGDVTRALASDLYESSKFTLRSCDLWLNDACLRVCKARARRVQSLDYPTARKATGV